MSGPPAEALLGSFDRTWSSLFATLEQVAVTDAASAMAAGWSAQEMLGHLSFWAECTAPVVVGMLRDDPAAMEGWEFGSGYRAHGREPWPVDSVHNAREAAWARHQTWAAVLARLNRARATARTTVESLTADESVDPKFVGYIEGSIAHVEEHHRELEQHLVA